MLSTIVYVSSAAPGFQQEELNDILTSARRNNAFSGVTGMLLFAEGNFFQVLEGPDKIVEETFSRIKLDSRHTGIIMLLRTAIEERSFPDWTMGFRKTDKSELPSGVFELTRENLQSVEKKGVGLDVLTLMKTFYRMVYPYEA